VKQILYKPVEPEALAKAVREGLEEATHG
jgi:hypothetical protein